MVSILCYMLLHMCHLFIKMGCFLCIYIIKHQLRVGLQAFLCFVEGFQNLKKKKNHDDWCTQKNQVERCGWFILCSTFFLDSFIKNLERYVCELFWILPFSLILSSTLFHHHCSTIPLHSYSSWDDRWDDHACPNMTLHPLTGKQSCRQMYCDDRSW